MKYLLFLICLLLVCLPACNTQSRVGALHWTVTIDEPGVEQPEPEPAPTPAAPG